MVDRGSQILWLSWFLFLLKLSATHQNNFKVNKKISYAGSYEEKTDKQDSFGDDLDRQVVDRQRERNTQFDDLHGNFKSRISQLIVNGRKRDLGQFNRQENFTSATRRELRVDRSTVPQSAILVLQIYFKPNSFTNVRRQQLVSDLSQGLHGDKSSCRILHVTPVDNKQSLVEVACKNKVNGMIAQRVSGHEDLIAAHDIVRALDWPTMKPFLQEFNVTAFGVKDLSEPELAVYQEMWFPVAIVAGVSVLLIFLAIICLLACRRRIQERDEEDGQGQKVDPEAQLRYPSVPINTMPASMIQPEAGRIYTISGIPAKPHKWKGSQLSLSDRRGSKASLVLDLRSSSSDTTSISSAALSIKESPTEEKLASKSKILTYNELEVCVDNLKQLYEQFWDLPMNHPAPEGRLPGSSYRNRYPFILPNSRSRVRLPEVPEDPLSSYINANFIKGYDGEPDVYIATQGPLSCTVKDFWRMIWYMHCPIVVMITKLQERNETKCERYWPDPTFKMQEKYGDIEVTFDSAIGRDGYQITSLFVNHSQSSEAPRRVYHYWYTAWPDHGVPDSPSQLLQLVEEVHMALERDNRERGPVVVHCSAGVGRTGCFIAASIGSRQIQKEDRIDILKIVSLMRIDRGGMVENDSQYVFINRAMLHYWRSLRSASSSEDEDEGRDVVLDALYE